MFVMRNTAKTNHITFVRENNKKKKSKIFDIYTRHSFYCLESAQSKLKQMGLALMNMRMHAHTNIWIFQ